VRRTAGSAAAGQSMSHGGADKRQMYPMEEVVFRTARERIA
jgi:hypothetical protein